MVSDLIGARGHLRSSLPRCRHRPFASTEGSSTKKPNKTGVRFWTDCGSRLGGAGLSSGQLERHESVLVYTGRPERSRWRSTGAWVTRSSRVRGHRRCP